MIVLVAGVICMCIVLVIVIGVLTHWYGLVPGTSLATGTPYATGTPSATTTLSATGTPSATAIQGALTIPFIDQPGNDMSGSPLSGVASANDCLGRCVATANCAGAVYAPSSKACWMKNAMNNTGFTFNTDRTVVHLGNVNLLVNNLISGTNLLNGSALLSTNQVFIALMQNDNNFVVYNLTTGSPVWSSNTSGKGSPDLAYLVLNPDGSMAVRAGVTSILWTNGVSGRTQVPFSLTLLNNGILSLAGSDNNAVWTSSSGVLGTNPPTTPPPNVLATLTGPNVSTVQITSIQLNAYVQLPQNATFTGVQLASGYHMWAWGPNGSLTLVGSSIITPLVNYTQVQVVSA